MLWSSQGIDFLSLSASSGGGAKLKSLNSGLVESTLPAPSSFMSSVQHQSPFSIQPAQLHTAHTDQQQQLAATAAQQVRALLLVALFISITRCLIKFWVLYRSLYRKANNYKILVNIVLNTCVKDADIALLSSEPCVREKFPGLSSAYASLASSSPSY